MRRLTMLLTVSLGMIALLAAPLSAAVVQHLAPCVYCHDVHIKYMGSLRAAACLSCHGPGGSATRRAVSHSRMDCRDCHKPHGTLKMLRNDVDKTGEHSDPQDLVDRFANQHLKSPPENYAKVVFASRGSTVGEPTLHSFADGDEDRNGIYDGICEVCHMDFLYNNGESPGTHHIGETCTVCHLHSNGFR